MSLTVDWCSYEAAKYAVEHWHYSKSLPVPPRVMIGVWESGAFIGCVIFSRGTNNNMHKPYGLVMNECCELSRVALSFHQSTVTSILRQSAKLLRLQSPGVRLIVSYADPNQGHVGAIYQAGNWIYTGQTSRDFQAVDSLGRIWHSRQVSRTGLKIQYGELRVVPKLDDCEVVPLLGKHRYLYPLDKAMRRQIEPLARPYPKRASMEQNGKPAAGQVVDTGSIPVARSNDVRAN